MYALGASARRRCASARPHSFPRSCMMAWSWWQCVKRKLASSKGRTCRHVPCTAFRPRFEPLEARLVLDTGMNRPFVAQVYRELLQREGSTAELGPWADLLESGTSRTQVVRLMENSTEYQRVVVNGLFNTILHRPADP